MGKARGIMRLSGKVDNVVFYERNGKQYFRKYDPSQSDRMKNVDPDSGWAISNTFKPGTQHFAQGIWSMMKKTGMTFSIAEWNAFVKHVHHCIVSHVNFRETIKADIAKSAVSGYKYAKDAKSKDIFCTLEDNILTIENSSLFNDRWKPEEGFEFQICRQQFKDVPFKEGKYRYTNVTVEHPAITGRFITSRDARKVVMEIEPLADNEIMVLGVYPLVDGLYPKISGASLWVY